MNTTNRFALTFETMAELLPEIRAANADVKLALPDLNSVLREYTPLPHDSIFLGIANDGLPVLLNLKDPLPGPILAAGDKGCGKTKLLKVIARAIDEGHDPESIRYVVLTTNIKDWDGFDQSENCEGILSFEQTLTTNYLDSLVDWAHANKQDKKFIVFLVDGLEALGKDEELHSSFRWILLRGPSRRIWPIVTLEASHLFEVNQWLASFRTRLFGQLTEEQDIQVLTGSSSFSYRELIAGSQFSMNENKVFIPFWLPNLD